jgi:hypothetical protein|tara:strand:- start:7379 stop:7801 length:423 start_codon:yes stop_codon:yes gene_type:complete
MENIKTKNFTSYEVIHRNPEKLSSSLAPIAYLVQGILQGFRNYLSLKYGKSIRLVPTSGYRSPNYNSSLEGSSKNSYHMWRYDKDGEAIWAVDLVSPDLEQDKLYNDAAAFFTGEVYKHSGNGLVHVSDYGANEDLGALF